MKRQWIVPALFVLLCLVQIAVVLAPVAAKNDLLENGRQFRLKAEPIEPCHLTAGGYLLIRCPLPGGATIMPRQESEIWEVGHCWVYAHLAAAADGYALVDGVTANKPADDAYVRVMVEGEPGQAAALYLPCERYYLEGEAIPAGRTHWTLDRTVGDVRAVVRVKAGRAAFEEVYLNGRPVRRFLELTED